jgi:large subunit ribosomal protein L21
MEELQRAGTIAFPSEITPKLASKAGSILYYRRCNMYAIIATGGKQYKVSEGDVIKVEKLDVEPGNTVTFDKVIAISDNGLKVAGDVANSTVSATVMEQGKGKKVIVYRYKRKTGYHKKNGHRQAYTQVKIDKINA